jgi:hypothetical protein
MLTELLGRKVQSLVAVAKAVVVYMFSLGCAFDPFCQQFAPTSTCSGTHRNYEPSDAQGWGCFVRRMGTASASPLYEDNIIIAPRACGCSSRGSPIQPKLLARKHSGTASNLPNCKISFCKTLLKNPVCLLDIRLTSIAFLLSLVPQASSRRKLLDLLLLGSLSGTSPVNLPLVAGRLGISFQASAATMVLVVGLSALSSPKFLPT